MRRERIRLPNPSGGLSAAGASRAVPTMYDSVHDAAGASSLILDRDAVDPGSKPPTHRHDRFDIREAQFGAAAATGFRRRRTPRRRDAFRRWMRFFRDCRNWGRHVQAPAIAGPEGPAG